MTDLVIGSRRGGARHRLRALVGVLVLAGLAAVVSYVIYHRMVTYEYPDVSASAAAVEAVPGEAAARSHSGVALGYDGAALSYRGAIALAELAGSAEAVGAQHGRLLAREAREVARTLDEAIAGTVDRDGFFASATRGMRLRWGFRLAADEIPGHQLVELAALIQGAARSGVELDYEAAVRRSAVLDVGVPSPRSSGARARTMSRSLSFVAPLRGAAGERLLIGRSFGLPGAPDGGVAAAEHPTLFTVRGDGVIPFAHVAWPGMTGVVSGINAERIAIMVHPVRTASVRVTRAAQPTTLIAREVLENARTLDDAIAVLEKAQPLGAAAFIVVDGKTRRWAVVERSPSEVDVRRDPDSAVVGDVFSGLAFADDPLIDRARRTRPIEMRSQRLAELLRTPLESPDDAAAVLRDRSGAGGAPLPVGHRGAIDDPAAVHTLLLDVSGLVLWLGDGPGAAGRFRAFDLRHLLRDEGKRPAPPPDVAGDAGAIASAEAVLAARALAREARSEAGAGADDHALELIERALAHAPELPEVLLLAGELAREAGKEDLAMSRFRRYLELGPDDLGAKQQVEAIVGPTGR